MRALRTAAATLLAVVSLAGCSTTVAGSGRYAGPAGPGPATSGGSTAGATPLDVWASVHDAIVDLPTVTVSGSFAGAGFGPGANGEATIKGGFGSKDGDPLAEITVTTGGATLEVRAVGGSAWVKAGTALLTAYGYDAAEAAKANGRWVVSTDDDAGLDVFASLDAFLQICAPENSTEDLTATTTTKGAIELASELEGGSVVVTTDPPRLVTSAFSGDDLTFGYPSTTLEVEAPPAAEVVTLPDF